MTDTKHESGRTRRRIHLSPVLTSAFALSVLTAMFFLQGRAFRTGWLDYFGLQHMQFPISSGEAYWLTLSGWATTSVRWFSSAWESYLEVLTRFGLLLVVLAMLIFALEWRKHHRAPKDTPDKGDDRNLAPEWMQVWLVSGSKLRHWFARAIASLVLAPLSLAVAPALLFGAGILLAAVIAIAFVPFQNLGKQAAIDFCKRPVSLGARVVLRNGHSPDWGYRIECNPDVCAIVRDGRVFVIPMENVEQIELPPLGSDPEKSSEAGQEQLCPTPDDSSAIPA